MPISDDDWRLQGQERYLQGVTLQRRDWPADQDHDHCQFCSVKFANLEGALRRGWATGAGDRWVCDCCFADFRVRFGWRVAEEASRWPG